MKRINAALSSLVCVLNTNWLARIALIGAVGLVAMAFQPDCPVGALCFRSTP